MRILRNEKQKDNLAKFFWDDAKIALAALVIGPITKPETAQIWVIGAGVLAALAFAVLGYLLVVWRSSHESPWYRILGNARYRRCRFSDSLPRQRTEVEREIKATCCEVTRNSQWRVGSQDSVHEHTLQIPYLL